jgi:hypothetical protein
MNDAISGGLGAACCVAAVVVGLPLVWFIATYNRFARLVSEQTDDRKVIEEIYLSCLCRLPTQKELSSIRLGDGAQRLEGAQDLAWALINSPAFLFNR